MPKRLIDLVDAELSHVRFDTGKTVHQSRELKPAGEPFVRLGRQIDQAGEIMLQEGVTYAPGNVPGTTMALHKGKLMKDVAAVTRRGDVVEVVQYLRNADGVFYLDHGETYARYNAKGERLTPPDKVAVRIALVSAKQFKLKYGIERSIYAQAIRKNRATIQALGEVERQHAW